MPPLISADAWPDRLSPGITVYAPGVNGESPVLVDALCRNPAACAGVHFIGVWLPGLNRTDYAGLHAEARATAFFISRDLRPSFAAGSITLLPLPYSAIFPYLREVAAIDVALLHVSLPDVQGRCSLGVANDFSPAVLDRAKVKIAHVNPLMPSTRGAALIPFDVFDAVVEAPAPLIADASIEDPVYARIGEHIATLIDDGDTIEVGIGRVQQVFTAFAGARRLRVHSGAVSTPLLRLVAAGALADDGGAVTTGVAYGSRELIDFVATDPRLRFASVAETHDPATLRAIPRFIAINSVIEVDLLGQANAEMVDGRQVSGAGGLTDFMRGARLSADGLGIVALGATADSGRISRIVPALASGTAVSIARGDMQVVVTEFGIADLRRKDVDQRASALIAIAAPPFREALTRYWRERRQRM